MSHVKRGRTPDGKEWAFYVDYSSDAEEVWKSIQDTAAMSLEERSALLLGAQGFRSGLLPTDPLWRDPLVSSTPDSVDVYEWWFESRKITIYSGIDSEEFVAVWGPNTETQMKDGSLQDTCFRTLWLWLHGLRPHREVFEE